MFPGSVAHGAGAPGSPGAFPSFLPSFFPSFLLLFSSLQSKQAGPCPIWLMSPEISPAPVITRDRWPGEIPGGCSPARGSHRELQLTDFAPGHPRGWQQLSPTLQAAGCAWIHGGISPCSLVVPTWGHSLLPLGFVPNVEHAAPPRGLPIIFPVPSQQCCVFSWEKKKSSFPTFFSLAVLTWGSGSIAGWLRDTHPSGGALSPAEQGFSRAAGVPAPRFWAGGARGALAGAGPAPAALFLSPCLERFSLYQRLRVFSAGD